MTDKELAHDIKRFQAEYYAKRKSGMGNVSFQFKGRKEGGDSWHKFQNATQLAEYVGSRCKGSSVLRHVQGRLVFKGWLFEFTDRSRYNSEAESEEKSKEDAMDVEGAVVGRAAMNAATAATATATATATAAAAAAPASGLPVRISREARQLQDDEMKNLSAYGDGEMTQGRRKRACTEVKEKEDEEDEEQKRAPVQVAPLAMEYDTPTELSNAVKNFMAKQQKEPQKDSTRQRPVSGRMKGFKRWFKLDSIKQAAGIIGTYSWHVLSAIKEGTELKGWEFKYYQQQQQQQQQQQDEEEDDDDEEEEEEEGEKEKEDEQDEDEENEDEEGEESRLKKKKKRNRNRVSTREPTRPRTSAKQLIIGALQHFGSRKVSKDEIFDYIKPDQAYEKTLTRALREHSKHTNRDGQWWRLTADDEYELLDEPVVSRKYKQKQWASWDGKKSQQKRRRRSDSGGSSSSDNESRAPTPRPLRPQQQMRPMQMRPMQKDRSCGCRAGAAHDENCTLKLLEEMKKR
jgi:hypothetical protein